MDTPDFTLRGYRALLQTAREAGYRFLAFDDPARFTTERVCLLRHDVDADLGAAVQVAQVEAETDVRATYFVMLRSPLYNPFGRANHRFIETLLALGHRLALHFDANFLPTADRSMEQQIRVEAGLLAEAFGTHITAVSFHQPGPDIVGGDVRVSGLVSTHDSVALAGFTYISDTNMTWREAPARELLMGGVHPKLHLLTHPIWWAADGDVRSTEQAWEDAVVANWSRSQQQLLDTERAYGPPRMMRLERAAPDRSA